MKGQRFVMMNGYMVGFNDERDWGFECDASERSYNAQWVNPNRRDEKGTHPYSYSEFFIFGSREIIAKTKGADYSDRLWEWDYDKAERLYKRHVNTSWNKATERQLSAFISAYHRKNLKVVALAEGCNGSNGYPYWILWYKEVKKK